MKKKRIKTPIRISETIHRFFSSIIHSSLSNVWNRLGDVSRVDGYLLVAAFAYLDVVLLRQ